MPNDDNAQQPSAPDLAAVLDETPEYTMVGADGGDLLDAGYVPPDRPYVLNDDQVTARGMWQGETLDQRLDQERPDVDLTTPSSDAESDRAGRLKADDYAPDTWSAESLDAVDVGILGGAATAEEAAVHVLPADADLDDDDLPRSPSPGTSRRA